MKGSTINMYFGQGTYVGNTIVSEAGPELTPEYVVAVLAKKHGRKTIPEKNFDYWVDGVDDMDLSDAIDQLRFKPRIDVSEEEYRFKVFVANMEGGPMPEKPKRPEPTKPIVGGKPNPPEKPSEKPAEKEESKRGMFWVKVGGAVASLSGLLGVASFFIPALKPIAKVIKAIADLF